MNAVNQTVKRILTANQIGVRFYYQDGHRYIDFSGCDLFDSLNPREKALGNIMDCLNFIDFLLKKIGSPCLLGQYEEYNDWGFCDEYVGNHTHWEESGTFTDIFFNERIKD